mgnify:CR=1 FL=1
MQKKVYSIHDTKAEAFIQPFFAPTDGLALRMFEDNVNNKDSQLNMHPEDFNLYQVGQWDDNKGLIEPETPPKHIGTAIEYLKGE